MISFFKKKTFSLKTDIHSHILHNIDDGSKSINDSLKMLKELSLIGIENAILTPHVIMDSYKNSKKKILEQFDILQKELNKSNINITIHVAAEYYLDEGFKFLLKNKEILTFGDHYILFETSYVSRPLDLESLIFQMLSNGYKPIMAHPERYVYFKNINDFKELKNNGIFFQININSFAGYYGRLAMKNAYNLAKEGMIDFIGTDTHRIDNIYMIKKVFENKRFIKSMETVKLKNGELQL